MPLHVQFEDSELPALKVLLLRALNTWNPADAPKWAYELDAKVEAKLTDLGINPNLTKDTLI